MSGRLQIWLPGRLKARPCGFGHVGQFFSWLFLCCVSVVADLEFKFVGLHSFLEAVEGLGVHFAQLENWVVI